MKRSQDTGRIIVDRPIYNVENYRADQILTSPLFGLESSLSPEKEGQFKVFCELSSEESLSKKQQKELFDLSQKLNVKIPTMDERAEARVARTMIKNAFEQEFEQMSDEAKQKVSQEIEMQLHELITGSLRP